ncbi:DUF2339 domain-containing protein [Bacillus songklensis]|uniref:DUF2339 domain-containing protein n=1 Tax=Bacillus songklensis TaxID=1069116 RepID=A0ABV8B4F9_9BACI
MLNKDQLEERVQSLEREVDELKTRIHQLENKMYFGDERPFPQKIKPDTQAKKPITNRSKEKVQSAPLQQKKVNRSSTDWEKALFQVWMPRLFIFVFIMGVLWAFKAASDYGLINETAKIAFGFVASGLLLYFGRKQMKQDRAKLGYVLLGGSIPLLMLTTFAMHSLYGMVGPAAAFVLNAVWIALGLTLTKNYQSEVLGMISMVGGVLVPFLIESETPNPYVFLGYETVLYLLFLSLSIRFHYMMIYYGSSILLNAALYVFYSFAGSFDPGSSVAIPIIIQYVFLLYYFVKAKTRVASQANTLLTSLFVTYVWVNGTFTDGGITLFLVSFIFIYAVFSYMRRSEPEKAAMFDIHLIVLIAFFIIHTVDERLITSLLLIQGAAAYYSSLKYPSLLKKIISLFIYIMAGFTVLFKGVIDEVISIETFDWIVLLVTFAAGAKLMRKHEKIKHERFMTISSAVFAVLTLIFTTQFTMACVHDMNDNSQRLILTFVWMVMSIASIAAGVLKESTQAKYIGVSLLILTLLKLALLDIPYIPLFIRAILFIALGFVGLIVSRIFYRKK